MKRRSATSPTRSPDRRKADRLSLPVRVSYRIKRDANLDLTGNTTASDLSGGGLRLLMSEEIPLNTPCELSIYLPAEQHPFTASGIITWCKRRSERDAATFEIGVTFTMMHRAERERYYQFICDQLLDHYLE